MNRIARTIGCLFSVVCLFSGVSAMSQTVTCPTKLLVTGSGISTSNSFAPGAAEVRITGNEMICVYTLTASTSVKAASSSACSSMTIKVVASLPSPYTPGLPGGFSPWTFNGSYSDLEFSKYSGGACNFGTASTPRVNLQSEIPSSYNCATGATGTSTFTCTGPSARDQICLPGQFPQYTTGGGQYSCNACPGNSFSNGTEQQCQACGPGSLADAAHNACNACSGNQVTQGSSCITCPPGDSPNGQHTACICTGNQISSGSSCVACPSGTTVNAGNTMCICSPPKVMQNGSCAVCPGGFVADTGFDACLPLASQSCVLQQNNTRQCTTGIGPINCNAINPNVNWVFAGTDTTPNCAGWYACCPKGYNATGWQTGCPSSSTPPTVSCTR